MIKRLYLQNWKNHNELDLDFKKGVNLIIGPNGSGKTSILEAIMFSFAARVRTKKDKKIFRKIGTRDTELILELEHGVDQYTIERSFNGNLTSKLNGTAIRNDAIFKKIVSLFKTNESFFENIIFSSEGENYQFLKMKAVNFRDYIEELINLGRTKNFRNVVSKVKQFYENENKKLKSKVKALGNSEIEKKYGDPIEFKLKKKDLKLSIESQDTQIQQKEQELKRVQKSLIRIEQNRKNFVRRESKLFELYDKYKEILMDFDITEANLKDLISNRNEMDQKFEEINKKLDSINGNLKNKEMELIKNRVVRDQKKQIQEIIEKLEDDYDKAQSINCPICKKLISRDEFLQIHEDNHTEVRILGELINKNKHIINELEQNKENLMEIKIKLKELQMHIKFIEKLEDKQTLDNNYNQQKEEEKRILQEIYNLKNIKRKKEKELGKIIEKISIIRVAEDFKKIMYSQEFENNLKGSIISEITLDAIENVLHIQRNLSLDSLIKKITEIWKVFFPKEEREIHFNPEYKPYFHFHEEEIPYDNISAGEKMILLILIKTLLINIYTDISFLILDEPLEHLNLENRIKIIDYFLELCEKNIIKQLIITTFEESLTRKYLNLDKKVNIISIPSLKKYKDLSP